MAKLAEYMAGFAALLGRDHAVHFTKLQTGSTEICALVEREDVPKVARRISEISLGIAPRDAAKSFHDLDQMLANDNTAGSIIRIGNDSLEENILQFPGNTQAKEQVFGPFYQDGHLDGILMRIGGTDDTISLQLQTDTKKIYSKIETDRLTAKQLRHCLFEPVRVFGRGRWLRDEKGQWVLLHFKVKQFEALENLSLVDAVKALRAAASNGWSDVDNPFDELQNFRSDDDGLH